MNKKQLHEQKLKIEHILSSLERYDHLRLQHAQKLSQTQSREEVANQCINLQDATNHSVKLLKELNQILLNLVAYLSEQPEPKPKFEKLLTLSGMYQQRMKDILKIRKKEYSRIEYLVKFLNHLNKPLISLFYRRTLKKIFSGLQEENYLTKQILSLYQKDNKHLQIILKLEKIEKRKAQLSAAASTAAILIPIAGFTLAYFLKEFFEYTNQFTYNYKILKIFHQ